MHTFKWNCFFLALGFPIEDSIFKAKEYLTGCLENAVKLGKGFGPVNHCFKISMNNKMK